jgi:hypothetical protein
VFSPERQDFAKGDVPAVGVVSMPMSRKCDFETDYRVGVRENRHRYFFPGES